MDFYQYFNNQDYYTTNITFIVILIIFMLKFTFSYFSQKNTKKSISINSTVQPINNKMRKNNYYIGLETCPTLKCPNGYKNVTHEEIETCDCAEGFAKVGKSGNYNDRYDGTCAPKCVAGTEEHIEYENNLVCAPICKPNYHRVNLGNGKFGCEINCRVLVCPAGFNRVGNNGENVTCERMPPK